MKLEIKDLTKQFNQTSVIDHVSFTLEPGIYALLGGNGAGKSTLLKMMTNLLQPSSGTIELNGHLISTIQMDYLDLLGYLPQDFPYIGSMKAWDFLLYMASLKGLEKQTANKRITYLLKKVGLYSKKDAKLKTYSGGMKQRIGICVALLNDPKILILDEPTVGLDPKQRANFQTMISEIATNRIVLLSTHIVSDVEDLANHILILKDGKLVETGPKEKVLEKLQGHIFECIVTKENENQLASSYKIVQKHVLENGLRKLRIVSFNKPRFASVEVQPTLEDVFLFYFDKESEEDEDVNVL